MVMLESSLTRSNLNIGHCSVVGIVEFEIRESDSLSRNYKFIVLVRTMVKDLI